MAGSREGKVLHGECKVQVFGGGFPPLRAAGSLIGEGITNFITDWDKISATVSR